MNVMNAVFCVISSKSSFIPTGRNVRSSNAPIRNIILPTSFEFQIKSHRCHRIFGRVVSDLDALRACSLDREVAMDFCELT